MSRSKHQFRPGAPEVFETRIVPTVIPIPGIPFVPPGAIGSSSPVHIAYTSNFTVDPGNTNQINAPRVTNNAGQDVWVTIAVYTAPGGGNGNSSSTSGPSENLKSQSLLAVIGTFKVPKDAVDYTIPNSSFDASVLDQQGPGINGNHFTGDDEFQCDMCEAPDHNGYAPPNKLDFAKQDIPLIVGALFQYLDANPHAKNK